MFHALLIAHWLQRAIIHRFFLITDGMVDPYDYAKAGLSFYYLQYGSGATPLNEEIAKAARQSQVLQFGQGLSFKPDSYDPEERAEFFTPDLVHPRAVAPIDGISGGLATSGVAFTYAKADAIRALVSDGLEGEPVLAFHKPDQLKSGNTGVFLSALDGAWTGSEAGRRTIETSLMQLVKWSDRNRYSFRLHDFGDEIALRVSVVSDKADAPLPQTLSATLLLAGQSIGVPMAAVEDERGVFEGRFALPDGKVAPEEASASARKGAVGQGAPLFAGRWRGRTGAAPGYSCCASLCCSTARETARKRPVPGPTFPG